MYNFDSALSPDRCYLARSILGLTWWSVSTCSVECGEDDIPADAIGGRVADSRSLSLILAVSAVIAAGGR